MSEGNNNLAKDLVLVKESNKRNFSQVNLSSPLSPAVEQAFGEEVDSDRRRKVSLDQDELGPTYHKVALKNYHVEETLQENNVEKGSDSKCVVSGKVLFNHVGQSDQKTCGLSPSPSCTWGPLADNACGLQSTCATFSTPIVLRGNSGPTSGLGPY